jgi:hypothetical protein
MGHSSLGGIEHNVHQESAAAMVDYLPVVIMLVKKLLCFEHLATQQAFPLLQPRIWA